MTQTLKKTILENFSKKNWNSPLKIYMKTLLQITKFLKKKNRNFKLHVGYCNNQTKINFPRKMREPILVGDIIT